MRVDLHVMEAALGCLHEGKALSSIKTLTHSRRAALMAQLSERELVTRPGRKYRLTAKGVDVWQRVRDLNRSLTGT